MRFIGIFKINDSAPFCNLFIEQPSYFLCHHSSKSDHCLESCDI